MVHPLWKTILQFLTKLNTILLYNPKIGLLGIYRKYIHTKSCAWMFIHNCQNVESNKMSFNRWVNKQSTLFTSTQWNINYLVTKRDELSSHETTRRNLKYILASQSNKMPCVIIRHFVKSKIIETLDRWLPKVWGEGSEEWRRINRKERFFRAVKLFCLIL